MANVARTMGVTYQSYQRMESGKNLTMKSFKKAAFALGSIVEIRLRKLSFYKASMLLLVCLIMPSNSQYSFLALLSKISAKVEFLSNETANPFKD